MSSTNQAKNQYLVLGEHLFNQDSNFIRRDNVFLKAWLEFGK